MKEMPTTEVLCSSTKDLLRVLNQTPQRYLPLEVQDCMLDLWQTLNSKEDEEKQLIEQAISPETVENEANELLERLDAVSGYIPNNIFNYIKKLQSVLNLRKIAS